MNKATNQPESGLINDEHIKDQPIREGDLQRQLYGASRREQIEQFRLLVKKIFPELIARDRAAAVKNAGNPVPEQLD